MGSRMRLLIADDEPIVRDTVRLLLGNIFDIEQTDSGEGLRRIVTRDFDAILLDIMFPDANGIDLCKELKSSYPHLTIVISSSMETVDAWNSAFEAGADSYIEKRELLNQDPRKISLMINNLVERNRLRKQTEEQNKWQAELLSVLSHDVRAPFQSVLSSLDRLRKSHLEPELERLVDTTLQSARQQLSFINALLELLRLESGMVSLRLTRFDPNLPVSQSVQTLKSLISEKGIELKLNLGKALPKFEADIAQVARMVTNLLGNAIKFTHRAGKIEVSTQRAQKYDIEGIEIVVKDNGIGINEIDKPKIFDKFHRCRDKGVQGETGSGLGLAICKELAQLHNGTISVDSHVGKGSEFRIWLPLESSALSGSYLREQALEAGN
jgi:signal transduction histidine kinase